MSYSADRSVRATSRPGKTVKATQGLRSLRSIGRFIDHSERRGDIGRQRIVETIVHFDETLPHAWLALARRRGEGHEARSRFSCLCDDDLVARRGFLHQTG